MRSPGTSPRLARPRPRSGLATSLAVALALALAAATTAAGTDPAAAGGAPLSYAVTTTDDVLDAPGGISLREAITLANGDGDHSQVNLQAGAHYVLDLCGGAGTESQNLSGDLDHTAAGEALVLAGFGATVEQTCAGERVLQSTQPASQLNILSTTITGGRTAETGGGIFSGGPLTLITSTVESNTGGNVGGGGVASFLDVTALSSTFRDNATSGLGGGVFSNEELVLAGSTVAGNVAADEGGGAYGGAGVRIERSTVTRNLAFGDGGGARSAGDIDVQGSTVVANRGTFGANLRATDDIEFRGSIIALGAGGGDCASSQVSTQGGNVGVDATCGSVAGDDLALVHPQIGPLADNGGDTETMRSVIGSPVVDQHVFPGPTCATSQDQRIVDRPQGPACDSGAYEGPAAACSPTFPDVGATHPFFVEVCWLAQSGITGGYPNGTFQPANPISRQAMAAFLHRLALSPPVLTGAPTFTDVSGSHPFFEEVEWMHQEAITEGFGDGTFRPLDPVSRQAMAAFLHRVAGEPGPAGAPPYFSDVPNSHPFFADVQWMYQEGVTTGFGDGTFHPSDPVSRQAMAAFLERMADEVVLAGL
jgi:hypothetical protein